ncbi:MAG: hypothetical protein P8Y27_13400, partial [Chromatiaceae bacterium]
QRMSVAAAMTVSLTPAPGPVGEGGRERATRDFHRKGVLQRQLPASVNGIPGEVESVAWCCE